MTWSHGYMPPFPAEAYDRWKTTDPRDREEERDRDEEPEPEELPSGEFGPGLEDEDAD